MNKQELYHHGILGQKWGVRRYQNEDGSLTEAGKKRYQKLQDTVNQRYNEYTKRSYKKLDKYSGRNDSKAIKKIEIAKANIDYAKKIKSIQEKEIEIGLEYLENEAERLGSMYGLGGAVGTMIGAPISSAKLNKKYGSEPYGTIKAREEASKELQTKIKEAKNDYRMRNTKNSGVANLNDNGTKTVEYKTKSDVLKANKQNMLENARKNDKYDITFMEAIQNKPWAQTDPNELRKSGYSEVSAKRKILSEYDKYLSDYDKWMSEWSK